MKIDLAAICFSALFVIICMYIAIVAVKWTLIAFGIQTIWWQFAFVFGCLWCVVIGVIMYFGMRKAKIKNGK